MNRTTIITTARVRSSKTIKKQQKKKHRQQKQQHSPIATHASFLITPSLHTIYSYSSTLSPLPTTTHTAIEPVKMDEQPTDTSTMEGISAAVITGKDAAATTISAASTNKAAQIAGPIVGVFAGVAFIAAAMLLVVRNRKKRQLTTVPHIADDKFHDISLVDEAITIPPLAKNRSIISNATDYYSLTDTLIGSVRAKKQQSWQSSSIDHRLSEVVSPTSTLVSHQHINSCLMVAERQQLQHERPSILDHFDKRIETYKAQLADIDAEEEEEPLPFIDTSNLNDYYNLE